MDQDPRFDAIRARRWFYEFELPDGSTTQTYIGPDILPIHTTRRRRLREVIAQRVPDAAALSAIDLACHEGYFSVELARHFRSVTGMDVRPDNISAATSIAAALGIANASFTLADLQTDALPETLGADFVLCFGLLYHLEDPLHALRLASRLARRHILIETQVFPYDIAGRLEDGAFGAQRNVEGVFSLSADYANVSVGGSTDLALVPSLNALLFLLRRFGFSHLEVLPAAADDYEQFRRGQRVIVYGAK